MADALLVLEDGTEFRGRGFGARGTTTGEAVFNTSLSGYQEVLTDPSYHGQLVTMTYPHIGNYGVNHEDVESSRVRVAGFVVREAVRTYSNHRATGSLHDYLTHAGIVGIEDVDTRRLTRHIRSLGAMRGAISTEVLDPNALRRQVLDSPEMTGLNLVDPVTTSEPFRAADAIGIATRQRDDGRIFTVAAYDYGIKRNILRLLGANGCDATVFPAAYPAEDILAQDFDGVFLSNGPGDPAAVKIAIANTKQILTAGRPLFGICLGHQILGLALGAKTYKLKFGHRGINQPVKRLQTGAVEITSHNHGFAVDPTSFEVPAEVSHVNLNDDTCEGIRCLEAPAFGVQYHPEAAPGPHDASYLFEEFVKLMEGSA
ncbi:MAG: glutamine-hydrolyzing carbamoyl-phosphate synthase small subunit [Actinomycetota bacterium]